MADILHVGEPICSYSCGLHIRKYFRGQHSHCSIFGIIRLDYMITSGSSDKCIWNIIYYEESFQVWFRLFSVKVYLRHLIISRAWKTVELVYYSHWMMTHAKFVTFFKTHPWTAGEGVRNDFEKGPNFAIRLYISAILLSAQSCRGKFGQLTCENSFPAILKSQMLDFLPAFFNWPEVCCNDPKSTSSAVNRGG